MRDMRTLACQFADVPHEIIVECGPNVWPSVERTIEDRSIDLIVLGTQVARDYQSFCWARLPRRFSAVTYSGTDDWAESASDPHHGISFRCDLARSDFSPIGRCRTLYSLSHRRAKRHSSSCTSFLNVVLQHTRTNHQLMSRGCTT